MYLCHYGDRMRFGIAKSEMKFPFVSVLTFRYLCIKERGYFRFLLERTGLDMSTLADVVLPLPLYKYFTYRIPSDLQEALQIGSRVVVPFGRKKYYTAIVVRLHDVMPQGYEVK